MLKRIAIAVLCVTTVACGNDAPTAPSIGPGISVTPNPAKAKTADLALSGGLTSNAVPPTFAAWDFAGTVRNRGDGCAGSVSGQVQLIDVEGQFVGGSRAFALATGTIIRPSETVPFSGCCFSMEELDRAVVVRASFTFQTVACS